MKLWECLDTLTDLADPNAARLRLAEKANQQLKAENATLKKYASKIEIKTFIKAKEAIHPEGIVNNPQAIKAIKAIQNAFERHIANLEMSRNGETSLNKEPNQ